MNLYQYHDLDPAPVKAQFDKVVTFLREGNFKAADVKKMTGTPYYRARLNDTDRLLFRFARYQEQQCLLLLEVILNHAYDKSRFLRGAGIEENKLQPLTTPGQVAATDVQPLAYVPAKGTRFHLLDKVLFFDEVQQEVLSLPVPLIIIGSAGSGKTALTWKKSSCSTAPKKPGPVLYVTLSAYLTENASRLYRGFGYENPPAGSRFSVIPGIPEKPSTFLG